MKNIRSIIVVSSGKGGVGKSTIAANLAISLSNRNQKVGLLDADIYGPSIPTLLNIHEQPKISEDKKILPFEKFNIKSMSIGNLIPREKPVIWRGTMVVKALNQLLTDIKWGNLDILVIDLPPGTGDVQLSLSQNIEIDGAIVVSTPQEVSLVDVRRAINMFKRVNINIIGIIENMSYFISNGEKKFVFGKEGVKKESISQNLNFLGQIPISEKISECSDQGIPVTSDTSKNLELLNIFNEMSKKIITNLKNPGENTKKNVKIEVEE